MNRTLQIRVLIFIFAVVSVASLTIWTANHTWAKLSVLGLEFTDAQLTSIESPNRFRQQLQRLDNLLLYYELKPNNEERQRFIKGFQELDDWIDEQQALQLTNRSQPTVIVQTASNILAQIDSAYTNYGRAAKLFLEAVDKNPATADFSPVDRESDTLTGLGYKLNEIQQQATSHFLTNARETILYFNKIALLALLACLFLTGWLAFTIYQATIAPLRLKLVESQKLAERHEKLASLGMLAAGVAHEIRNPLTAIKAWLFMHQKHLVPGTQEHGDAEIIQKEINRLERIVRDFLQFARPSEPDPQKLTADQLLRELQNLMKLQLQKCNIRLELGETDSSTVHLDPGQIKQVLINLIQNAADSVGQNGVITLKARRQTRVLRGRTREAVVLEVADTGAGIPPEVEKRLFDPFFTTKDSGTGLGLSIAARIVEGHGGVLQYQTRVNKGTTFGIVLPVD